jgi:hypothetical protein
MAVHVAARFASDPAVFGIELFNEPVADDPLIHPLYAEMVPPLRAAAPQKLVLWEPSVYRNQFDYAPQGDGGALGTGTVYSPHVYTDAFSGTDEFSQTTLSTSNTNAIAEAQSWGAPLVITEWGFGPTSTRFDDYVTYQQNLQDQVRASAFFWVWKEISQGNWGFFDDSDGGTTERTAMEQALSRPRLEAAAGELVSVAYDGTATLTVRFNGSASVTGPNVVSIGAEAAVPAAQWTATCDGAKVATSGSDPLQIACSGPGVHTLEVTSAK